LVSAGDTSVLCTPTTRRSTVFSGASVKDTNSTTGYVDVKVGRRNVTTIIGGLDDQSLAGQFVEDDLVASALEARFVV